MKGTQQYWYVQDEHGTQHAVCGLMIPEISTSESRVPRTFANDTCTTKRNNLAERTGVVPAEYPPKVKLELYAHCSRVLERVNYAYLE